MVEENEVSLQADEDFIVGEKRDNGFSETSSSDQSICMPNFMTPPSIFIVYVLTCTYM